MNNFSQEEISAAKSIRESIINGDTNFSVKGAYMAGEICMWDELRQSPSGVDVLVEALEKIAKQIKVNEHDGTAMFPELVRECKERVQIARDALAQYNAVEPEPWKSVEKDGYPEYNRGLIVCIPDEDYHITSGMWDRDNKWVLLDDYRVPDCPVTHYMPLPPFPKQFQNEIRENDAVMEHLAKLLKMGKIKKPETFPSKSPSPEHPSDIEPEGIDIVKTENELLSKCLNMLRYLYMNEYCGEHGPEVFELIKEK